jgi:hypothetical protein
MVTSGQRSKRVRVRQLRPRELVWDFEGAGVELHVELHQIPLETWRARPEFHEDPERWHVIETVASSHVLAARASLRVHRGGT